MSIKDLFINGLKGMAIGVANIIPGVSGGTIAVVLNIYDKILNAFSIKNIKKNLPFLLAIGLGAGIGIFIFANVVTYLYEKYPMETNFAFIGLILGSIPLIYRKAKFDGIKLNNLIPLVLAFLGMLSLNFLASNVIISSPTIDLTSNKFYLLFVSMISAFAMVLPGVSGSMVMVIFGAYATVNHAITIFDFSILIPVGIGAIIGILFAIKIIKVLLVSHPQATYLAILGLILGSIPMIWPGFAFNMSGTVSIIIMILGFMIAYAMSKTE